MTCRTFLLIFILCVLFLHTLPAQRNCEFPIATGPSGQRSPAAYGDIVVWTDERNHNQDIYGYNLKMQEEFQVTTNVDNQYQPAIYEDIVVYTDSRNGNSDIYGYDLETGRELQITTDHSQWDPAIYEDVVVDLMRGMDLMMSMDVISQQERSFL